MALGMKDVLGSKKISPSLLKFSCTRQKCWPLGDPIYSLISPFSEGLSFRSLKLGSRKKAELHCLDLVSEIPPRRGGKCCRVQILTDWTSYSEDTQMGASACVLRLQRDRKCKLVTLWAAQSCPGCFMDWSTIRICYFSLLNPSFLRHLLPEPAGP